jgi:hypothetical protein
MISRKLCSRLLVPKSLKRLLSRISRQEDIGMYHSAETSLLSHSDGFHVALPTPGSRYTGEVAESPARTGASTVTIPSLSAQTFPALPLSTAPIIS